MVGGGGVHAHAAVDGSALTLFVEEIFKSTGEERTKAINKMEAYLYHELQHAVTGGIDIGEIEDSVEQLHVDPAFEEQIKGVVYLCHPKEIPAHARETAIIYRQNFPGQPYTEANYKEMLLRPVTSGGNQLFYYQLLVVPEQEERYIKYSEKYKAVQQLYGYSLKEAATKFFELLRTYIPEVN